MKKFLLKFWKKNKKDFIPLILLISLSFYAWRFFLDWIIQAQGFMYFDPRTLNTYLSSFWRLITTAQVAGVILSSFIVKLAGVNFPLYMWIQMIIMLFIGSLFYFVVKVVTKNRFIAFSAALIYTVSYFGNFDMYVIDYSAHLLERASFNVICLLSSFLFLHLFLEKAKQKYYLISIIFFFVGVMSSHFSIVFTAPFFFYPFFWYLLNKKNPVKGIFVGVSYVLVSGFFIFLSSIGSEPVLGRHEGFLQFLLNPAKYRYPEGMLLQLTYWSQYPSIIKAFLADLYPLSVFDPATGATLKPIIITVYSVAIFIVYKALSDKRAIILTTIVGLASIFLINMYLGRYDPFYSAGTSRYLYFPTYLFAIFWSLFIWVLFKNKNFVLKTSGILLLAGYYYINMYLIFVHFSKFNADARSQKAIFNHIITTREKLKPNTLVIAPYPDIAEYEGPFFTSQLGRGQVRYMSAFALISEWPKHASSSAHVISLKFDTQCQCVIEEMIK